MRRFIAGGCLLVLLAASAQALMAPEFYRQARADAAFHVQVAVDKVTPPAKGPGSCLIEGKIATVFRDAGNKLPVGAPVSFSIACHRDGEQVPIGGAKWTDTETLKNAKYIEAYLVPGVDGYAVAMWNSKIISAPSPTPQYPVDD
jgi:hypothetical protein